MGNYQNKTKEELIIALEKLQQLNDSLIYSHNNSEKEYKDDEEQKLHEKDLQFRKLSANVPDLIFQFTRRTDGSYFVPIASEGIKNIFGCLPEDVVDDFSPIAKVIYSEDSERVINDIEYSANHLTYFTCEFRVQIPGKEIQWIYSKSTPEKLPDGSVTWYGFNANITEQKKAEERLANEKRRLSDILKGTNIGTWEWNIQTGETIYNKRWAEIIGYTLDEISPINIETWAKFANPDDLKISNELLEKHFNGEIEYYECEGRMKHKNGHWIWVLDKGSVHSWDKDGNPLFMSGTHQDITERKTIEAELKKSEERYQDLLNNLNVGVVVHAPDTSILMNNSKASELLGLSNDQLKGKLAIDSNWKFISENYIPKPLEEYPVNIIKNSHKELKDYVLGIKQPDKNDVNWVSVNGFPVFDSAGQLCEIVISFIDITERKLAEEKLKEGYSLLRIAEEKAKLGGWSVNLEKNSCYWSEEIAAIHEMPLGYSPLVEEAIGFYAPEWRDKITDVFTNCSQNGVPYDEEMQIITPSGKRVWVRTIGEAVKDPSGRIVKVQGAFQDITERKIAEEALRESEEKFRSILESTNDFIWTVDPVNFGIQSYNRALYKYFLENGIKMKIGDTPEILAASKEKDWKYFYNKVLEFGNYETEYEVIASSHILHLSLNKLVRDNQVFGISVFGRDITNQKQNEKELILAKDKAEKSEKILQGILDNLQDAYFQADLSGNFTFVNPSAVAMYGYDSIKEMIGMPASSLYADKKDREILIEKLSASGKIRDYIGRGRKKDGYSFWVSMSIQFIKDNNGQIIGTEGVVRDISERKQAEDQIRKLSQAVEQSPASIILTDTKGNVEYANPKTLEITGYELNELKGKNPKIFSSGEKPANEYKNLWETISSGKEWRGEFHNKKKSGELFWELASISPIINENGEIINFLAVKEDITEHKKILNDLIVAKEHAEESDRLKSAFLANMSHEIRTPMNGILGFAGLLKEPGISGEKQQKYIKIIEKSGERMLNIINDIVDISKIESGLMEVCVTETDINDKIENLFNFFKPEADAKNIQFSIEKILPENDAIIKTDSEKLYAILSNLLKNAIKFTTKGEIEFGVGYESSSTGKKQLKFFVKDTGIGIPKDRQKAIFERFIQADIYDKMALQGAGLGLSIAKAYTEMLGGKIWTESEEGIGSVFYFTIPCNKETEEKNIVQEDGESLKADKKAGNLKILIAEDDEASQMFLSMIVEGYASEIFIAKNGFEVVEISQNHRDIDLILMDIQMPNLNGYEATQQIRQFNKDVIIIAQTAYGFSADKEKAIKAGCNDYISKPIKIDDLIALIQKYFN